MPVVCSFLFCLSLFYLRTCCWFFFYLTQALKIWDILYFHVHSLWVFRRNKPARWLIQQTVINKRWSLPLNPFFPKSLPGLLALYSLPCYYNQGSTPKLWSFLHWQLHLHIKENVFVIWCYCMKTQHVNVYERQKDHPVNNYDKIKTWY